MYVYIHIRKAPGYHHSVDILRYVCIFTLIYTKFWYLPWCTQNSSMCLCTNLCIRIHLLHLYVCVQVHVYAHIHNTLLSCCTWNLWYIQKFPLHMYHTFIYVDTYVRTNMFWLQRSVWVCVRRVCVFMGVCICMYTYIRLLMHMFVYQEGQFLWECHVYVCMYIRKAYPCELSFECQIETILNKNEIF
jgi:hypothetical protein